MVGVLSLMDIIRNPRITICNEDMIDIEKYFDSRYFLFMLRDR